MSDAPVNFWSNFRQRIIVVSEMDREIRLTFITGAAVVAVAVFLNLFTLAQRGGVSTLVGRIPVLTLVFFSLGEMIVTFLLFAGVARLAGWIRLGALVLLALPLLGLFWLSHSFVGIGLLLPLSVLGIVAWVADKQQWSPRRRTLVVAALALLSVVIAAIYVGAGAGRLIISVVGIQAMFSMFGLFMAATDLGELTELGAESLGARLAEFLHSTRGRVALAVVLALVDIAVATILVATDSNELSLAIGAAIGGGLFVALLLGLTLWLLVSCVQRLGAVEPHITYRSLLLIVGTSFFALQGALLWRFLLDPATYDAKASFGYVQVADAYLLVFLVSLIFLLTLGHRSPRFFAPAALGVVVGVLGFTHYIYHANDIAYVGYSIGIGTILMLTAGRFVRVVRANFATICILLTELNLTAIAFTFLFWLFFPIGEEAPFGFWQAMFLLAALGWDIVSSGPVTTSKDSKRFPRFTRVCLFFAYIISVAVLVMLGRSAEIVDPFQHTRTVFNSEAYVALGLGLFGVPFYVFVFALRVRAAVFAGPKRAQPAAIPAAPALAADKT